MAETNIEHIGSRVISIRNTPVIVDRDVADIYGVTTKEINQSIRNNPKKFPEGYVITLTKSEKTELVKNFDRFNALKHSTVLPHAFTEKGLYMLATILKSDVATEATIAIIETFTKLRELARTIEATNEAGVVEKEAHDGSVHQQSSCDHEENDLLHQYRHNQVLSGDYQRKERQIAVNKNI